MTEQQQLFLQGYLATLTPAQRAHQGEIVAEHFCGDEENANLCAQLIDAGKKRATCSLKAAYDLEAEALPVVGKLTLVLNWHQEPVCIVKNTQVALCRFDEVTPAFAKAEGEGDGSYQWWRAAHIAFFEDYAQQIGVTFNESSELVLEHFEKVYPE